MNAANTLTQGLALTDAQMAQQVDLSRRLLHMAALGTPRIESREPCAPQLLVLAALITAYQALATATPGISRIASSMAFDISHELTVVAERHAKAH